MEPTHSPCGRKRSRIGNKLVEACAEETPERIVYLWNLDAQHR